MPSREALQEFLGWCTVLNFAVLTLATIGIVATRGWIAEFHGRLFGLDEADLSRAYFQYLAQYKIAIFVFNLAPYAALRLGG